MAATGFLSPQQQLFDQNGDPLAGGLIYTYIAGTDTPLDTWQDSDLSIANTNPIICDSAGRYVIFVSPTPALKVIVTDAAGVTITTQDTISPAAVAS